MNPQEATRQLWQECFDDDPAFVALYFQQRYTDDINQTVYRGEHLIAALQRVPYPLRWHGVTLPVAYVSGACTHPDFRRQGVMGSLLRDTHRRMAADGKLLSTLIPANPPLWDYYRKHGYGTLFFRALQSVQRTKIDLPNEYTFEIVTSLSDEAFSFIESQNRLADNRILHDRADLYLISEDLRLSNGRWACLKKGQQCIALAPFTQTETKIHLPACWSWGSSDKEILIQALLEHTQCQEAEMAEADPSATHPYGMGRILHLPRLLELYARFHPQLEVDWQVEADPDLPENAGCYHLSQGKCRRTVPPATGVTHFTLDQLAERLFQDDPLFMNLMLE